MPFDSKVQALKYSAILEGFRKKENFRTSLDLKKEWRKAYTCVS